MIENVKKLAAQKRRGTRRLEFKEKSTPLANENQTDGEKDLLEESPNKFDDDLTGSIEV